MTVGHVHCTSVLGTKYSQSLLLSGSHIKGLFINFVHTFWPALLQQGYVEEFITPIIKVSRVGAKGKGKDNQLAFYSIPEYEKWKKESGIGTDADQKWRIKYYKGLGTNTTEEGKAYFSQLDSHRISFVWSGDEDGKLIEMAFKKDQAEARKDWLSKYALANQGEIFVDHSVKHLNFSDFINKVPRLDLLAFPIPACN